MRRRRRSIKRDPAPSHNVNCLSLIKSLLPTISGSLVKVKEEILEAVTVGKMREGPEKI